MEIRKSVDQRRELAVTVFVERHAEQLAQRGAIVASFRSRGGRRAGPYYRLTCRDDAGRQISVYLGSAEELVAQTRRRLAELQARGQERRRLRAARQALRRELRRANWSLDLELAKIGLRRQGAEIRGWRMAGPLTIEVLGPSVPES